MEFGRLADRITIAQAIGKSAEKKGGTRLAKFTDRWHVGLRCVLEKSELALAVFASI